ncbi:MAG: hypothetical protein NT125_06365 [Candidatus Bipolaricaulota bacterium]|nr:hypothetical protein [Candidatus Bipolaricaulota bacterium]
MGISEAHSIFKDALKDRTKFENAGKELGKATKAFFPGLEGAYLLLGKVKSAVPGTPQRSTYLREFAKAIASCAANSVRIRDASKNLVDVTVEVGRLLDESQRALG